MSKLSHEEQAKIAYEARIQAIDGIHALVKSDRLRSAPEKANALGQNVLQEELGRFGPWTGANYELDDQQRNLLLAHVRQDVAACFGLLSSLALEMSAIQTELRLRRRRQRLLICLLSVFAAVSIYSFWTILDWNFEIWKVVSGLND